MRLVTPPDADSALVKALGDFCTRFLRAPARQAAPLVMRGYANRVSKPAGSDYVLVTPLSMTRLATNRHGWDAESGTTSVIQPVRRRVQLDCYGACAAQWAKTLTTLLRDPIGADFLAPYGVAPLSCEDPQELTEEAGDEQWQPRFMVQAFLQVNDITAVGLDFFTDVNLSLHPQP